LISKEEITSILNGYNSNEISIGTICSHTSLQIFHGAKQEGFKTIGICMKDRNRLYESFPLAKPDIFLTVDHYSEILETDFQETLKENNVILIPHGSFIEYIGPDKIYDRLSVPMFGNRKSLQWESDRELQRKWIESAGLIMPRKYKDPSEIDSKVFVKFPGAKGGKGFFTVNSEKEFYSEMKERVNKGVIQEKDIPYIGIQEFLLGVRYYPHYFYTLFENTGRSTGKGHVQLLGIDRRIEPIDEAYRGLPDVPPEFFDYTVTGNQPVVLRESLLPEVLEFGVNVVNTSIQPFNPGIVGAFCLETIYHPSRGFVVFEISARIVAGTNVYADGSQYSQYVYNIPMSMGRRIAREIRLGVELGQLSQVVY
jgi:5-formaminoimidazole-4-carboxamide-1-(beta)-D-ribofuranosyl 5'-monophosphate synthetase